MLQLQNKFASKKELYKHLKENKDFYKNQKKATTKTFVINSFGLTPSSASVVKADDEDGNIIKRTIVANTTMLLDSHNDVHVDGLWKRTLNAKSERIEHLAEHNFNFENLISKETKVYTQEFEWQQLGAEYKGTTQALLMDTVIDKTINERFFNMYAKGLVEQHSVGMQYIQIELAINDSEMKEEYREFEKYIDLIGNKEQAIEQGFFFVVKEAKLKEVSAVLAGSNNITPTLQDSHISTPKLELDSEPVTSKGFDWEKFNSNFK